MLTAYLLVSHGSRDPRPQIAMEKLAELVRTQLDIQAATGTPGASDRKALLSHLKPLWESEAQQIAGNVTVASNAVYPLVGTATLELADTPLHEQICQFASLALAAGCKQVQLLPIFLLPGVHVREDIPKEVALAQKSLRAIAIEQRPHLGAHPKLGSMLASQLAAVDVEAKVLLAHGTRRAGGNEPVEAVASQLGAVAAYWSTSPSLEEQIVVLAKAGYQQIAILPYFLFCGGITDAIAQTVANLQVQLKLQLNLAHPIGVSPQLAKLIVELTQAELKPGDAHQPG